MTPRVEAERLASALKRVVRGEVRFDAGSRGLYSTDASNYRQVPIGVVLPRDADDVLETARLCREFGAPILARGGGTSLAGQCCNVAVVLDFSRHMGRVLGVDPARRLARVQPGVVLDELRAAARPHGLTFGPDPATHTHCTLGGMIGNDSCGIHSVLSAHYGPGPRTGDQVEELEVLTGDGERLRVGATGDEDLERLIVAGGRRGEIYRRLRELRDRHADRIRERFPDIPRRVSGYNLPALLPESGFHVARALVGSESTCALTLEATVRLVPAPQHRSLLVLGYPTVFEAGDDVPEIMGYRPIGLEGMDARLVEDMRRKGLNTRQLEYLPNGGGWLLVEFMGQTREDAHERAREVQTALERRAAPPESRLLDDPAMARKVWEIRESGLGATAFVPGDPPTWPGWEDAAVPPDRVGEYLRDFRSLLERHGYGCALYGHFGQGCIHTRIDFDLRTRDGITRYRGFLEEAADLVVSYGGSISGEHGDGQARGALLEKMYGPDTLEAFREFKAIWDPEGLMNPGKLVDARPPDEDLRLGTGYRPAAVDTHFAFPRDGFSFADATLRCVGVGECRRKEGGTMCPSYMVTGEEMHSTRGRARLLHEMMRGEVVTGGWRSEEVKEALDLCLSCKGCKGDCPVNVDMATYKAEFLSHYYEGRLRPRHAYAMGLVYWWSRLGSTAPRLVNRLANAPALSGLLKRLAGIAPERELPRFADQTFRRWWRERREGTGPGGPRVLLWPDTFNNFFHPEVARAAVEVLEGAGFRVDVPDVMLCCGRPLYDYGMLDTARHLLRRILVALRDDIRAGVPVVGLEPSCVATFRDELPNLLPHDEDAKRLARQTRLLSELLVERVPDFQPGTLDGRALVHGHCHHRSLLGFDAQVELLKRTGLDYEVLDSGCCGMAGSFGFEADHYDVSQACAERVLLPRVRAAPEDTLILTDGFSCREILEQNGIRRPLHLAEVLRAALGGQARGPAVTPRSYFEPTDNGKGALWAGALTAAGAGLSWLAWRALSSRH